MTWRQRTTDDVSEYLWFILRAPIILTGIYLVARGCWWLITLLERSW